MWLNNTPVPGLRLFPFVAQSTHLLWLLHPEPRTPFQSSVCALLCDRPAIRLQVSPSARLGHPLFSRYQYVLCIMRSELWPWRFHARCTLLAPQLHSSVPLCPPSREGCGQALQLDSLYAPVPSKQLACLLLAVHCSRFPLCSAAAPSLAIVSENGWST